MFIFNFNDDSVFLPFVLVYSSFIYLSLNDISYIYKPVRLLFLYETLKSSSSGKGYGLKGNLFYETSAMLKLLSPIE